MCYSYQQQEQKKATRQCNIKKDKEKMKKSEGEEEYQ